jgi:hypothetical protein
VKTVPFNGFPHVQVDAIIIATAGINDDGTVPENGFKRLRAAAEVIKAGGASILVIVGGKRERMVSEAVAYYKYFKERWPDEERLIRSDIIVLAREACTNRDLPDMAPSLDFALAKKGISRHEARLGFPSYQEHLDQIELVMRYLGYDGERLVGLITGEKCHYSQNEVNFLRWLTKRDPTFRGLLGSLVVARANQRIYQKPVVPATK